MDVAVTGGQRTPKTGSYRCKGSHVVQSRAWINQRLGEGAFEALVEGNGPPWTANLLVATWYDVGPLNQALKQVAKKLGRTVVDITREIARQNALNDLRTIYRIFLSMAAPVRVMGFTPQLWSTYVKFGQATAIRNEPGHYIGECRGIPGELLDWVCGAWLGFVPTTIEVAGGKNVRSAISQRWIDPPGSGTYCIQCEVIYDP